MRELYPDTPTDRAKRRVRVSHSICSRGRVCSMVGVCPCQPEQPVTVVIVDPYTGKEVGRL